MCTFHFLSGSLRSHSMNNLLDPSTDSYIDQLERRSLGDVPPPATPDHRASVDVQPVSPLPKKRLESVIETKATQTKSYSEHAPPPPPLPPPPPPTNHRLRSSSDFRSVSSLPDRKGETANDIKVSKA